MKQWIVLTVTLAAATAWGNQEAANFIEGWSFARFGAMPDGSEKAERRLELLVP